MRRAWMSFVTISAILVISDSNFALAQFTTRVPAVDITAAVRDTSTPTIGQPALASPSQTPPLPVATAIAAATAVVTATPTAITTPRGPGICVSFSGYFPPELAYINNPGILVDNFSLCMSWHLNYFPLNVNGRNYTMPPLQPLPPDASFFEITARATSLLDPSPAQCNEPCGYYRTKTAARAAGANFDVFDCGERPSSDSPDGRGVECVLVRINKDYRTGTPPEDAVPVTCLVNETQTNECAQVLAPFVGDVPILFDPLQSAICEDVTTNPDVFFSMQTGQAFPANLGGRQQTVTCAQAIMSRSRLTSATDGYRPFYSTIIEIVPTNTFGETPVLSCKDRQWADWWRARAAAPRPQTLPGGDGRNAASAASASCFMYGTPFGAGMGSGATCRVVTPEASAPVR